MRLLGRETELLSYQPKRKLPLTRLADMAELPPRYVAIVMSEIWPEIHKMLVA